MMSNFKELKIYISLDWNDYINIAPKCKKKVSYHQTYYG